MIINMKKGPDGCYVQDLAPKIIVKKKEQGHEHPQDCPTCNSMNNYIAQIFLNAEQK